MKRSRSLALLLGLLVLFVSRSRSAASPPTAASADVDTDGDGLSDFDEVRKYRTDPQKADSDGDGKSDGDGDERREFTYSIRCVVEHLPPADAITDGWQDARVIERSADAVRLEIVAYPLATPDDDVSNDVEWRAHARDFAEFTKPNLTSNFDDAMKRELVRALRGDGIDATALGDRDLVLKASGWAFHRSRFVSMGFSTFCVTAKNGHLVTEPGLDAYMADACATEAEADDGKPVSLPHPRTVEQQFDAECRGRSMFSLRVHGSCTSSAIYLETVLRALGVPTRTTIAMPPADGNDESQVAMLRSALRPSAIRDAVLEGPHGGWSEHTFNTVRVGGRWRRLNYSRLGQPIVDREYLGLMLRILEYDDIATSGVSATWGKKWALVTKSERFPHRNPYRLIEASDLLGPHATVTLPAPASAEPAAERMSLTVTAASWADGLSDSPTMSGRDALELTLAGSVAGESYKPYTRFAENADLRFVLRAEGQRDVPAAYEGFTVPRADGQHMVLALRRADLAAGVSYELHPLNERGTRRWSVADGVTIRR